MTAPRHRRPLIAAIGPLVLLGACAVQADHFYDLRVLPAQPPATRAEQPLYVRLDVTIPALVDRPQMLLGTGADGVAVLEHERWAAPLSDLVASTLARDIERRRADLLIGDRGFERTERGALHVQVDITELMARRGGADAGARLEAQWRIRDPRNGLDRAGSEVFATPLGTDGYEAVATAFSLALDSLAQRLAAALPAP